MQRPATVSVLGSENFGTDRPRIRYRRSPRLAAHTRDRLVLAGPLGNKSLRARIETNPTAMNRTT